MKRQCKSCGKQFELTEGEINFYKSKNLHLPKRCKECRNNQKTTKPKKNNLLIYVAALLVICAIALPSALEKFADALSIPSNNAPSIPSNDAPSIPSNDASAIIPSDSYSYKFRTGELLTEHFNKHGIEMGFDSENGYEERAAEIANDKDSLSTLQDDGDTAYFLQNTGEFVVISNDGFIRTFFIPEDGIEYFNRQ